MKTVFTRINATMRKKNSAQLGNLPHPLAILSQQNKRDIGTLIKHLSVLRNIYTLSTVTVVKVIKKCDFEINSASGTLKI